MLAVILVLSEATKKTLWDYVIPLVAILAVVAGWFLNEISSWFRGRRQDRRAVGRVLAELLEIRHRLRVLPAVIAEIRKRTPIPPEAEVALRNFFDSFLPDIGGVQERYNKAIDLVAGRFPLLAFQLRRKEMVGPYLQRLRTMVPPEASAAAFMLGLENQLAHELSPVLDELLSKLAWYHSWITWVRLKVRLKESLEIPKELMDFLDRAIASAQNASPAQGSSAGGPK